jgi:uncharacterized membrane protein YciS (DUF1049 family)
MRTFITTFLLTTSGFSAFSAGKSGDIVRELKAENDSYVMLVYLLSAILIAVVIAFVLFIVFIMHKKLKLKDRIIADKNEHLKRMNEKLTDNARVTEEYVGYFINVISGYILKIEKIKRGIERKLMVKKYEDILLSFNDINIKKERETLFNAFDHTFLKIFPNFIAVFNSMLKEEDQVWPARNEGLTTDLRIFALIRLGIADCETIASILEYSANTIYVYKMRIKAKAMIPADQFDQMIMSVKAAPYDDEPVLYRKSA